MASLTVIWWRDIPAQVLAREGRRASKVQLHPRFQVAIDKAASRAGKRTYNDYIEEWRKVARNCGEDLEAEVNAEVARLETEYDRHRLAELIQTGGVAGGPIFPPAHDETQRGPREANAAHPTTTDNAAHPTTTDPGSTHPAAVPASADTADPTPSPSPTEGEPA
ncbi:MAG: virulence factor [Chloroflexota bacterium]|nr:virulence factor [Chloroflexota bacterium]